LEIILNEVVVLTIKLVMDAQEYTVDLLCPYKFSKDLKFV